MGLAGTAVGRPEGKGDRAAAGAALSTLDRRVALVVVILVAALRIAGPTASGVAYVVLALYALGGGQRAIRALGLSFLLTMVNEGLADPAAIGAMGRYFVLLGAAVGVTPTWIARARARRLDRAVLGTLGLGMIVVVHSLLVSPVPDVSILKALSWTVAVAALYSAWTGLNEIQRRQVGQEVFGGLLVVLLVSAPLLATGVGYLRNGRGFQGVLNHPQAFGAAMAPLAAWLAAGLLSQKRATWLRPVAFVAALVMIVLSQARTAGVAFLAGTIAAGALAIVGRRQPLREVLPGLWSRRIHLLAFVGSAALLLGGPLLAEKLGGYIWKTSEASSAADLFEKSRGRFTSDMLANIREEPLLGIGFGVASDHRAMVVDRDPVLGLPLGAAVEKGVMPLAVLEELGIPGASLVAAWILMVVRRAARGGFESSSVALTLLFLNVGEATLFSPGGLGLLVLLLLTWASSAAPAPKRGQARA